MTEDNTVPVLERGGRSDTACRDLCMVSLNYQTQHTQLKIFQFNAKYLLLKGKCVKSHNLTEDRKIKRNHIKE